jgi:GDP-L-fucose synthase
MTTGYLTGKRVWVAGHTGMVGSALVRRLEKDSVDLITATSPEVDLRRQEPTEEFVLESRPEVGFIAAAVVGGIHANRSAQGRFLYENLMIAANAIEACRQAGVEKVVVLGSSCIYPRETSQPIAEEQLLTGPLEETNEGYAIAKIAALEMGKMYRRQYGVDVVSLMPTNLYGPGDNYDLETSHVLPALLRKIHEAKVNGADEVEVWGSGRPRREFLYVDDAADAAVFAATRYSGEQHLNVGTGEDISIADLARLIAEIVGWEGRLVFDATMPDGTMLKRLDVSRIESLGWSHSVGLREGIELTYASFLEQEDVLRRTPAGSSSPT